MRLFKRSTYHLTLLAVSLLVLPLSAAHSAENNPSMDKKIPELVEFKTEHKGNFGGQSVKYKVIAGEIALSNKDGEVTGHLFSTSYFRTNHNEGSKRPVAFIFNGGPGSASMWLHMGLLGPKKVDVVSDASDDDGAAPYSISNNPDSLLDKADLVFIDPIGTGYSRLVGKGEPKDYWGLKADTSSVAEFIRIWITKHKRWNSPKYIIGESYGSPRAAGVAKALRSNGKDIALNGIVMISQAMDYTGSTPIDDNLIAYVTFFPTYAAIAHFHGKAGKGESLEAFVEKSRVFASDEYLPALFKGNQLSASEKSDIAQKVASFTGLNKDYVLRSDLRILASRFSKELLREEGKTVGFLDGRYTHTEIDQVAGRPTGDAAGESIRSAYSVAINQYFQSELKVDLERQYYTSSPDVGRHWDWSPIEANAYGEPEFINVSRILSKQMRRNKDLKVLVASGYYDMITPFFDAEYTFARHGIDKSQVTMTYYPAGHMMYVNEPSFIDLIKDMRAFIK
jgi:carboxypeptidase C (cathepsin A)